MFLEKIIAKKRESLTLRKQQLPLFEILDKLPATNSEKKFYNEVAAKGLSIIGEIKRASPSKGTIKKDLLINKIVENYAECVRCISVLTEENYFLGSPNDLVQVYTRTSLPLLRKDFIVDPYQIYEAKYLGAHCVLLIASILDKKTLKSFNDLAKSLGLDTLIEVHSESDIEKAHYADATIIGINNRDLTDFTVDIKKTLGLRPLISSDILVVSESGIQSKEDIQILKQTKIDGVLIGETFMRSPNIKNTALELIAAYDA
ncbi:indole-3-glycerol phosphate synthase TrpC [Serpentinicella sp. ANB-PHB4]|uniref:indole-3-glycerol phosphate synthase TrpC n=1 Tax=Serpentinicella sp. ANB-PHB4 TaxID=3074076 RepID=UPI0028674D34|nr:indole-3-glycerol phosphate synthase TrpC [Serpentinicella sp. ANB-PHB4]MDR5659156.1 indole-3-glycerol phosphate synthase TrpC [Serpentinicella sp. ANB-PHB4]